jgi:hypothetical protein
MLRLNIALQALRNIILVAGLLSLFWGFMNLAQAQTGLVERVVEGTTPEKNPVLAKKNLIDAASEDATRTLTMEMIGEAKYNRNRTLIQNKIMKNSARFIPFLKSGQLQPQADGGFKMSTVVKVSLNDLQAMLLENGLLYEMDGTPVVLPFVKIIDKVNGRNFIWWAEAEKADEVFVVKIAKQLEDALKSELQKDFFYLLRPVMHHWRESIPGNLQADNIRPEDQQWLAEKWGAQMLVSGDLTLSRHKDRADSFSIFGRLTATQVPNGRVVAEVVREYETEPGVFEAQVDRKIKSVLTTISADLSNQILDAWQKGAIGASLYKISVRGRLPIQHQETVKELFRNKVREIKSIRERSISVNEIIFEVDSGVSPAEIGKKAQVLEYPNGKLVLQSTSETEAIYRIEK